MQGLPAFPGSFSTSASAVSICQAAACEHQSVPCFRRLRPQPPTRPGTRRVFREVDAQQLVSASQLVQVGGDEPPELVILTYRSVPNAESTHLTYLNAMCRNRVPGRLKLFDRLCFSALRVVDRRNCQAITTSRRRTRSKR
jgi:hypothetical protein